MSLAVCLAQYELGAAHPHGASVRGGHSASLDCRCAPQRGAERFFRAIQLDVRTNWAWPIHGVGDDSSICWQFLGDVVQPPEPVRS